jgi:hypothetical protein
MCVCVCVPRAAAADQSKVEIAGEAEYRVHVRELADVVVPDGVHLTLWHPSSTV